MEQQKQNFILYMLDRESKFNYEGIYIVPSWFNKEQFSVINTLIQDSVDFKRYGTKHFKTQESILDSLREKKSFEEVDSNFKQGVIEASLQIAQRNNLDLVLLKETEDYFHRDIFASYYKQLL